MYANQVYQSDEEEIVENGVAALALFFNAIKESNMLKLLFVSIGKTFEKYKHSNSASQKEMIAVACMRQLSGNNLETMAQWGTSRHVKSKKGVLRILGQTGFFGKIVDVLNRQVSIQQHAKRRDFFLYVVRIQALVSNGALLRIQTGLLNSAKVMSQRFTEVWIRREAICSQIDQGHLTIPAHTVLSNGARFRDLRLSIQIMMDQIQSNDSLKAGLVAVKGVRVGVPHYLYVVEIDLFPRTADKPWGHCWSSNPLPGK